MGEPLETHYNGCIYRSRLEARWAVFFDALGVPYEYQKAGFTLEGVWYHPDFWLPAQHCWVIITGPPATSEEQKQGFLLALYTEKPTYLFAGEEGSIRAPGRAAAPPVAYRYLPVPDVWDNVPLFGWGECPYCRAVGLEWVQGDAFLPCGCLQQHFPQVSVLKITGGEGIQDRPGESIEAAVAHHNWWEAKVATGLSTTDAPRVKAAYAAARRARFKKGEYGLQG